MGSHDRLSSSEDSCYQESVSDEVSTLKAITVNDNVDNSSLDTICMTKSV